MANQVQIRITKSDFLLFCEAPRHLWAKKHDRLEEHTSEFDQHLMEEGSKVEGIALEYLAKIFIPGHPGETLLWQQTYADGAFEARMDALVKKENSNRYDLYEIKSSTGVDKENIYDVTFQAAILEKQLQVDHYYVMHLDKEYHRSGELDLAALFTPEEVTEKVHALMPEVLMLREEARRAAQLVDPNEAEGCLAPRDCPCPELCHPDLPEFSIFDIPRLSKIKKIQLLEKGIRAAKDIPADFELNDKQRQIAELARTNKEFINRKALQAELESFQYPLWFLDYETCISAIPLFEGYHPQQQIVFQYSLHRLEGPGGELQQFHYIGGTKEDPSLALLEQLSRELGARGTVMVWNKSFEMSMNRGMAELHPEYGGFLEEVNARIYDLGDVVNLGFYLHPGFKGSWSIKSVLPAMVPELSYDELAINKGDQASMAWWRMKFGEMGEQEKEALVKELEEYCRMDTMAMVEIYGKIRLIVGSR